MRRTANIVALILIVLAGLCQFAGRAHAEELILVDSWCGEIESATRIECDHSAHTLFVSGPRSGQIAVFDLNGSVLNTINTVAHPTALAADGNGHLFVVDDALIRKLDISGNVLMTIGESAPFLQDPHDLAVAQDGRIFVADRGDTVKVFDSTGTFVMSFGRWGYFPARFDVPVSLVIDNDRNELFIADQNNSRIQVFSLDGVYLRTWGSLGNGNYAPSQFLRLWGIAQDGGSQIWALDGILNTIQVFSADGIYASQYSLPEPLPHTAVDMAIDGNTIFVTSPTLHCVFVYQMPAPGALDLTIMAEAEGLVLHWNAIPGAMSYHIVRSDDAEFSPDSLHDLGLVLDTFFVDEASLSLADKSFFVVSAIFPDGIVSSGERGNEFTHEGGRQDIPLFRHDEPHQILHQVYCSSCHFSNYNYPAPFPEWWFGDQLCKSCHMETGKAQPEQNHFAAADTIYCVVCHNPHSQHPEYPHNFIREVVATPNSGNRIVSYTGAADFVHGAPDYDGICEVCHTETAYHRNNESGDHSHEFGSDCTSCHSHLNGFLPTGERLVNRQ